GVVEVVFPTGFGVAGAACDLPSCTASATNQKVVLSGITLSASDDVSIPMSGITNPASSGGYGSFSILTRHTSGG
ncbi:MAG: hypothetical protein V2I33_20295, partial [Kangiellaceae bacterium]|nr:hypothetical protein [Kangiellaceae bacterium]